MTGRAAAGGLAIGCLPLLAAPIGLVMLIGLAVAATIGGAPALAWPGTGLSNQVPPQYQSSIQAAAAACPGLPSSLLAAQLDAESGWQPDAVSPAGAQGIAQFLPGTWATWGRDGDGDGAADPFNPADAIAAQGGFMCSLLRKATTAGWGDPLELALAAYNAGWGAVAAAHGIPPFPETRAYVSRIRARQAQYTATPPAGDSAVWPLPDPDPITNGYLHSPPAGVSYTLGYHTGIDLNADHRIGGSDYGQPVVAARGGVVAQIVHQGPLGLYVLIRHPDGKYSAYCHLSGTVTGLAVGQQVAVGQQIAMVGCSGMSNCAPHLHFEVRRSPAWAKGNFVDPITWLRLGLP